MTIAIVDDSLFMRRLIRATFAQLDATSQITDFADPEEALRRLPELAPDLITVDMLMPKVSGIEFLTRLRDPPCQVTARVVVITADIQKSVRQRCADLGVQDFIEKPITPEKLQAALARFAP